MLVSGNPTAKQERLMFFEEPTKGPLPYSEDGQLAACRRTEAYLSALPKKREEESRWVYARITRMAILPYACTTAGLISGLLAQMTLLVGCGVPIESAEDAFCMCTPALMALVGMALAWKINVSSYALLLFVLQQRPDIYSHLVEIAKDDPVIHRPLARLAYMLRACPQH